ncbi:hypothetical protein I4F81_001206 [Pyropia yezoensis]|uniref:Uncharacterized protein n=1 Tax=Pyropia yezoensis TaxID=2788 RepID=A0ACC3BLH6_PYRYE|nr:hypothetical protein I4F81_001206 [Neopyropia yezoensis]
MVASAGLAGLVDAIAQAITATALLLYPAYTLLRELPPSPPSGVPAPPPTAAAVGRLHRALWVAMPPLAAATAAAAIDAPASVVVPCWYPLLAAAAVWLVLPPGGKGAGAGRRQRESPAEAAVRLWGGGVATAVLEWRRSGRLVWRGGDGQG